MSDRRQWGMVLGVILALALLVGAGWLVRDRFLPVDVGSKAPDVSATTLDGKPISLNDLRGQVVLVNIWATWCGPCREEMPSMQRLYSRFADRGFRIVALSVDAEKGSVDADGRPGGDVAEFAREYGLTFDVWRDPAGASQRAYRTTGVPESFLVGRDGRIVKKVIGAAEWDTPANAQLIQSLLAE